MYEANEELTLCRQMRFIRKGVILLGCNRYTHIEINAFKLRSLSSAHDNVFEQSFQQSQHVLDPLDMLPIWYESVFVLSSVLIRLIL